MSAVAESGVSQSIPAESRGAGFFALHLLFRALRDPSAVGSWLPRLVASWRVGLLEAAKAKEDLRAYKVEIQREADRELRREEGRFLEALSMLPEVTETQIFGDTQDPPDLLDAIEGRLPDPPA